jgi:mono/diheme cytochrome c family protein
MNVKKSWLYLFLIAPLVVGVGVVLADRDEHESEAHEGFFFSWFRADSMEVDAVGGKRYQEECGICHFPFQPGFLPEASWQLVMSGLEDHFGENAELTDEDHEFILNYLMMHAAENSDQAMSRKVLWSLRSISDTIRITETPFFKHEHDEISPRLLNYKGEKIAFSNCDTCHTQALQGSYNEHEIKIPGYGRWDDD